MQIVKFYPIHRTMSDLAPQDKAIIAEQLNLRDLHRANRRDNPYRYAARGVCHPCHGHYRQTRLTKAGLQQWAIKRSTGQYP
jgi:hypothetical protein